MQPIDVSFVILSYNRFDMLRQTIYSIVEHTKDISYEIIIIDNNSSDGDIFEELSSIHDIKIYKNERNLGWPAGINCGIKKTIGKYICIVDNDVIFIENTAKILLDFSNDLDEKVIVGPRLLNEDRTIQISIADYPGFLKLFFITILFNRLFPKNSFFNYEHLNYQKSDNPFMVETLIGASLFFPKTLWDRLGGFDQNYFFYYSDTDFCWQYKKKNGKVFYHPKTSIIHLGSISTKTTFLKGFDLIAIDSIRFYKKNYNVILRSFCYFLLCFAVGVRIPLWFIYGVLIFNKKLIKKSQLLFVKLFYLIKGIIIYGYR